MNRGTEFGTLLRRLARGLARIEREEICCSDFTLQQFDTLRLLHESPGLATSEVSERLGIDLSTASRNLAVLHRDGYLARTQSREDARRVHHRLSAKGARCVDTLCCDERVVFASVLARIPAAQRESVHAALEVLTSALDAPAQSSSACCAPGACAPARGARS